MIVTIHQPDFLPWIGFFDRIERSDLFVVLDDVQFINRGYHNRIKIKNPNGWQWLTVPVKRKFLQKINEVEINEKQDWRSKHVMALSRNYGRAPYFKEYYKKFFEIYENEWGYLIDLNMKLIELTMRTLKINTPIVKSSTLNVKGKKNELLTDICRKVGADTYLSGTGAKSYMNEEKFVENGINVIYQNYTHPAYPKRFGEFLPYMSIIDLIFNCGKESIDIIKSGRTS